MSIAITLTDAQIEHVTREVLDAGSIATLLADADTAQRIHEVIALLQDDSKYSRATLRALAVLAAFPDDGSLRELTSVAEEVELSPSTTHRYISTWLVLGVLDRDPDSRRYRRVRPLPADDD
jgi:hypothetical protein